MTILTLQFPSDFDSKLKKYLKAQGLKYLTDIKTKNPTETIKFRFSKGILYRDFHDGVLKFVDEKDKEFAIISTAMGLGVGERIDAANRNIEMEPRALYDATRRINEKIKKTFNISGFFENNFQNHYIKRLVE